MKILINFKYILPLCLVTMVFACKKDTMTYDSSDSVFFAADSTVFTFYDKPGSVTKDTIDIAIQLIGKLSEKDREVKIVVDSTDGVTEGKEFTIIRPIVLSKDSSTGWMKVVLNRTGDLAVFSRNIWMSIRSSGNIDAATFPHTSHKLVYSDKIEKPEWWNLYFINFQFSVTRMKFYIEVMGSAETPGDEYYPSKLNYTLYKLKKALQEYNRAHPGEPLEDEFGPISWDN